MLVNKNKIKAQYISLAATTKTHQKPCFCILPLKFGGIVIFTNITKQWFCVKTEMIIHWKCLDTPDDEISLATWISTRAFLVIAARHCSIWQEYLIVCLLTPKRTGVVSINVTKIDFFVSCGLINFGETSRYYWCSILIVMKWSLWLLNCDVIHRDKKAMSQWLSVFFLPLICAFLSLDH